MKRFLLLTVILILLSSAASAGDSVTFGTRSGENHYQLRLTGGRIGSVDFITNSQITAQWFYIIIVDQNIVSVIILGVTTLYFYDGWLYAPEINVWFKIES